MIRHVATRVLDENAVSSSGQKKKEERMAEVLKANILANFAFYRRSRFLHGIRAGIFVA